MSKAWDRLGLNHKPNRLEDIHSAYESQKEILSENGDPMGQLSLEDAYLTALSLWEKDDEYCDKAVKTDHIFESLVAEHAKTEPLTADELQEIGTHIMRTLHNPWKRNAIESWKAIFAIDPIECPSDRQFENLLREALLQYFGYHDDTSGMRNKSGGPRLMQPKIAQYIFDRAEWQSYQKSSSEKERRELSWLRRELDVDVSVSERIDAGFRDFYVASGALLIILVAFFKILAWLRA